MKDLIEAAILLVFILVMFAFGSIIIHQDTQQQAGESKPTLNLCSAGAIQIGEDIEYVYVKVKK